MIYFLIGYLFAIGAGILQVKSQNTRSKFKAENYSGGASFAIIAAFVYFMIGIVTGDPLFTDILCNQTGACLPSTYEWIAAIALVLIAAWFIVIQPMRKQITELKDNSLKSTTKLSHLEKNVDRILDAIVSEKVSKRKTKK